VLLVWVAVVVVAATACAGAPQPSANAGSGLARVGGPAPGLRLPLLDGGTRDLVGERGKVVLLNFWATWCVPCREEMPELQRLADDLHEQPFTLLTIDLEEDSQAIAAFRQDLGLRVPVLMDEDGDVAQSYGVRALPATFLIDDAGALRQQRLGPLLKGEVGTPWSRAWLASQVQALLGAVRQGAIRTDQAA
jgi:thiol-disulfide isomerase/thioredoxin